MKKFNREWVKSAAIIFLLVMGALTFFSNTILNFSLPEVETAQPQSGTISNAIRGQADVQSMGSYSVEVEIARRIIAVYVREGDTVEQGQPLFLLEEAENPNLEQLYTLRLQRQKMLLDLAQSDFASQNEGIRQIREDLDRAVAAREELGTVNLTLHQARQRVEEANERMGRYAENLADLEHELVLLNAHDIRSAYIGDLVRAYQRALADFLEHVGMTYEEWQGRSPEPPYVPEPPPLPPDPTPTPNFNVTFHMNTTDSVGNQPSPNPQSVASGGVATRPILNPTRTGYLFVEWVTTSDGNTPFLFQWTPITGHTTVYALWIVDLAAPLSTAPLNLNQQWWSAERWAEHVEDARHEMLLEAMRVRPRLIDRITNAERASTHATHYFNNAVATMERVQEIGVADESVRQMERTLNTALINLANDEQQASTAHASQILDLRDLERRIRELEDRIERQDGGLDGGDVTITARYDGVVLNLTAVAGQNANPGIPLARIEVAHMGYVAELTTDTRQAQEVRPGQGVEVSSMNWWANLTGVVTSIRPNPDNPANQRIISVEIHGDQIFAGEQVTLRIPISSARFEVIVPRSAVAQDAEGHHVFVLVSRASPLGTRYTARRVDVTIEAEDETHMAIRGDLDRWSNVIIRSSASLSDRDAVRLAVN
ncbi:MAG: InlB B-repeat-containing protein [Oscillospiraceae bacterium]|nr:InlB B-repeat-containing protein [Oscillospiraceae bacterium]